MFSFTHEFNNNNNSRFMKSDEYLLWLGHTEQTNKYFWLNNLEYYNILLKFS
jgi:hypothetical protein